MTDVTKIGNARKATQYGISEKDKSSLWIKCLTLDNIAMMKSYTSSCTTRCRRKARKQKEFSDWEKWIRKCINNVKKYFDEQYQILYEVLRRTGMMRLPAGVTDFVTGNELYKATLCKVSMTSLLEVVQQSWWYSWTDCWYCSRPSW